MGSADEVVRTTEVLTRLAVVGRTLGIDLGAMQAHLPRFGSAPGRYVRVWLGENLEALGIRCRQEDGVEPREQLRPAPTSSPSTNDPTTLTSSVPAAGVPPRRSRTQWLVR